MELLIIALLIFATASCNMGHQYGQSTFDVTKYGAKGDGYSNDTHAFVNAWSALCGSSNAVAELIVPSGHTFLVHQMRFKGPCQSKNIHIKILGNISAPQKTEWGGKCSHMWLHFFNISDMTLYGSGVIDGQGQTWWHNVSEACKTLPTALVFERCDGLQISGISHKNGPGFHIHVVHSRNVAISQVNIHSTLESHNTDGIDITNSIWVNIHNVIIGTGDDCIAIKGGSKFINISQVTCGPGHGISVGSIGEELGQEEFVDNVKVWDCIFNGVDSAARIKTWPGGKGHVKAITFEHITINQAFYPIFIDQHYMGTPEKPDAVKVTEVTFSDIHGTCSGENAVVLDCAKIGCNNITLNQINITSIDQNKSVSSICNNAQGTATNITSPLIPCMNK